MAPTERGTWLERRIYLLLRLFFRLLYHEFAWTYDSVAAVVSLGRWRDWVLAVIPFIEGGRVLELGHGPGHLQVALRSRSMNVFGLDASLQMGRLASRNLRRANLDRRLCRAQSQAIPFPDRTFKTIVATFPSEYILDHRSLQEIWRALAPRGRLILLPYAWITGNRPLERAAAWLFQVTHQATSLPALNGAEARNLVLQADSADFDLWFGFFARPIKELDFQLSGRIINFEGSAVGLLIAEKPGLEFNP